VLDGLPTLRLRGPVDAATANHVERELLRGSRDGVRELTVDLGGVTHLGSVGIRLLRRACRGASGGAAPVHLVAPDGSAAAFALDLVALTRASVAPG